MNRVSLSLRFKRFLVRLAARKGTIAKPSSPFDAITATAFLAQYIGSTAAAFIVSNWVAIAILIYQIYGASQQRRSARRDEANAKARYNAGLVDRSVTLLQAVPPLRIVYGECVTGGDIVAIFTTDKLNGRRSDGSTYTKYDGLKHLVIHIASHQSEAIGEIYIEGVPLGPLDGSGLVQIGSEFYATRELREEVVLAPGGAATFPASSPGMTVHSATYVVPGASQLDNSTAEGTYSLSGGNTIITNTTADQALTVVVTYPLIEQAVRVQKHLGTAAQTVAISLQVVDCSPWMARFCTKILPDLDVALTYVERHF